MMQSLGTFSRRVSARMVTGLAGQMASLSGLGLAVVLVGWSMIMHGLVNHLLERRWRSQVRQQLELAASLLAYGLSVGEDLLVVSVLGHLAITPEVQSAMVLDRTGHVLAHPQPTERGKRLDDPLSLRCARVSQFTFLEDRSFPYRDVAMPLSQETSSLGILRVTYRDPRQDGVQEAFWVCWWVCSGGIWLCGVWGSYRLAGMIASPLAKAVQALPAVPHQPLPGNPAAWFIHRNEVGQILQRIEPLCHRLADHEGQQQAALACWTRRLTLLLQALGRQWPGEIIMTDGHHQVLFASLAASEHFCAGGLVREGCHLFDVLNHGECRDLFTRSLQTPNQPFQAAFRGIPGTVAALHVADDHIFGAFLLSCPLPPLAPSHVIKV